MRRLLVVLLLLTGCRHAIVVRPTGPRPTVFIHDVSVLDVESGRRIPHRDVLVRAGRIVSLADTGSIRVPVGAQVLEGVAGTLLPGLIDAHAHVEQAMAPPWVTALPNVKRNLQCFLYCGVTTLLDPADLTPDIFELRDGIAHGRVLGPHLYVSGPAFTAPGGHPVAMIHALLPWWLRGYAISRISRQIAQPAEAEAAVASLAALHPDVIKVIVDSLPPGVPKLSQASVEAIVTAAKRHHLRTVAHIGTIDDGLVAARAGVDAWMHGVYQERIPDERIPQFASFHIPMVPTMVVFDSYAIYGVEPRVGTRLEREIAGQELLRGFEHFPQDDPRARQFESFFKILRAHRQDARDNVRRLRAAGVLILAGSDSQPGVFPGASLHRELHLLTEAGFTPAEAIRAATIDNARFLADAHDPDFGLVAAGKRADLLLVNGDPTADLDALSDIRAVLLDGVVLERHPVE